MKKFFIAGAIALATFCSAQASAFQNGDWVLAQWKGANYWFPGVVDGTNGNTIRVRFDDGTVDARPSNQVKPYNWDVGSKVECQWNSGVEWFPGRIANVGRDGTTIGVRYDDGDSEQTRTGKCRSR